MIKIRYYLGVLLTLVSPCIVLQTAEKKPLAILVECSNGNQLPHPVINCVQNLLQRCALGIFKGVRFHDAQVVQDGSWQEDLEQLEANGLDLDICVQRIDELVTILRVQDAAIGESSRAYKLKRKPSKNGYTRYLQRLLEPEPRGRLLSQSLLSNGFVDETFETITAPVEGKKSVPACRVDVTSIGYCAVRKTFYNHHGYSVQHLEFIKG